MFDFTNIYQLTQINVHIQKIMLIKIKSYDLNSGNVPAAGTLNFR